MPNCSKKKTQYMCKVCCSKKGNPKQCRKKSHCDSDLKIKDIVKYMKNKTGKQLPRKAIVIKLKF